VALIAIDGSHGEGGGQVLRAALTLSAVSSQGFEITKIRARRARPGLRPQHVAAVRATVLACGARASGAFEGSPDLRFEPGKAAAGEFRFEIGTAGATTLVAQTVLPILGTADAESRVEVQGGTHVPLSPVFPYLARHWAAVVSRLGLSTRHELRRAGFYPRGGGELFCRVSPWARPGGALVMESRGRLLAVRGVSAAAKLKGDVAKRQRDAAQARLWEARRLEAEWEVSDLPAESPGSALYLEAEFEAGRAAFSWLGEKGLRAERLGDRAARRLLHFLDDEEDAAVDPHLADQLVVPLCLSGGGGRVSTSEVTSHLETVVGVAHLFGFAVRLSGRHGGPGRVEVERC
jgi:RNA 3'-terminal phosphate cyclase (ATP)